MRSCRQQPVLRNAVPRPVCSFCPAAQPSLRKPGMRPARPSCEDVVRRAVEDLPVLRCKAEPVGGGEVGGTAGKNVAPSKRNSLG